MVACQVFSCGDVWGTVAISINATGARICFTNGIHVVRVKKFAVTHMQACNAEKLSSKMHLRKVQMQNAIALSFKDYGVTLAGA